MIEFSRKIVVKCHILFSIFTFYITSVECEFIPFIEGGNVTNIKYYPHSVFLMISCHGHYICGGSILNQNIILTAGHCLEECNRKSKVVIQYGSEHLKSMKWTFMKLYKIHPDYDTYLMNNDLALMLTMKPIALGKNVKRVILLKYPPPFQWAAVSGWGVTNKLQDRATQLKATKQKLQNRKICSLLSLPKGAFCAGPPQETGNPAEGDSGGALIVDHFIQVGIVSYKVDQFKLTAYSNVSYHYNWITNTANSLYCN